MLAHQDKIRIFGHRIPQYGWFVVSGFCCDIITFMLDRIIALVYILEWEKATVCWTLSYTISIVARHTSHRLIVFGDYEGSYWASLGRMYMTYSSTIVLSVIFNWVVVKYLLFPHTVAWLATLIWTGIYNYCLIKSTWNKAQPPDYKAVSTQEV